MSLATKCGALDPEGGSSIEVHRFKDGVIQLHAIGDFPDEEALPSADLSRLHWQVCTLSERDVETLIWSLQQALHPSLTNPIGR